MRLHVMAALTFADQLHELRRRIVALEADQARARDAGAQRLADDEGLHRDIAAKVNDAAERIERLSATLASKTR
jgi:cell division protein ZapA